VRRNPSCDTQKRSAGQCGHPFLKLANVLVADLQGVKHPQSSGEEKRNRVFRSEMAERLEHSDYSFGLWIQNRKNAVFGFIKDLNTVVTLRGPGKKANSKKSMLSSQPIGCHGSLPSPFQVMSRGAQGTNHQTNKRETE